MTSPSLRLLAAALTLLLAPALHAGKPQPLTSPDQVPEGLGKSDWSSIRAAHEGWKHQIHAVEGGWQARNPGQQWTTRFDGRGFLSTPKDADWTWGLEFQSYGFGDRQTRVSGTPEVRADGQRLTYQWSDTVEEWFVNDGRGLEHGFTIAERPAGSRKNEALALTLATRGPLKPSLSADRQTVHFRDAATAPVLNYSGLKVWDADGTVLPSRFQVVGREVRLLVEENEARYPLTIDPIAQQAYLKAENNGGPTNDEFGYSVAVDGDTVIVGARFEGSGTTGVNSTPNHSASNSGAAYVFLHSAGGWTQQAYLKPAAVGTTQTGDEFGYSVAVSGDTVVVGARYEDSNTTGVQAGAGTPTESARNAGASYVFVRTAGVWSQQAYLKPAAIGTTQADDEFGCSVAVSGDTVVVGARAEDSGTTGINSTPNDNAFTAGAAYVFVLNTGVWTQQAYLKPAAVGTTQAGDEFGNSVAVSGDTVVVGAYLEDSSTTGVNGVTNESASSSGAAYVFVRSAGLWSQQAYLKPAAVGTTQDGDNFGTSVAVSGDTVVVGARYEDSGTTGVNSTPNESASNAGAAYVFVRSSGVWSQQAYLKPAVVGTTQDVDKFGWSVAVSGDTVVVGANEEASSTTGINSAPNESAIRAGAAYVFVRNAGAWSQQAYLKPGAVGTTQEYDHFGHAVAVSGNTVVVGANEEDSNTQGVQAGVGAPNEGYVASGPPNIRGESGAAYIFVRSGGTWSQEAFAKASNAPTATGVDDRFGNSVAVSGDTVVVGAWSEDSGTTGVNSTPNESASNAGAAYVFVRSAGIWSQQAYLKPAAIGTTQVSDLFGRSVAVSGDTIVVGADSEGSGTMGVQAGTGTPDESASGAGAAYVFVRNAGVWTQQAYLKPAAVGTTQTGDGFGYSVAVSGDTVVVGALFESSSTTGINSTPNESASSAGAAYVFFRIAGTWSQQAYLKPAAVGTTQADDFFGSSVAVSGDTIVVGAQREDSSTTGLQAGAGTPDESAASAGAAYVFARSSGAWSQQAYLKPAIVGTTQAGDNFGYSVAVSGDTVIVGAYQEDSSTTGVQAGAGTPDESASSAGAAYLFVRSAGTWSQQAYLKPAAVGTTQAGDGFGGSVAVSGDTIVVGAAGEGSGTTGVNSIPNQSAGFSGAAYVFVKSAGVWSQQAYLKPAAVGTTQVQDSFGRSVAVSGDTVVVGAEGEDSSSTGINSTADEGASRSGAAYIFTGLGPPPLLGLVSPSTGSTSGGTTLTITGTNFTGASSVMIGGIPATSFTVNSATSITATTAAHPPGIVDVEVTTPIGTATGSGLFTFLGREIAVDGPNGNDLTSEVSTVDIGGVLTNAPASRTFVIRNTGNIPLGELAVSIGGTHDVEFVAVQPTGTLNGGGSTSFTVTFTPTALGLRSATLLIASDDENEDPFEIALLGTGSTAQQLLNGYATGAGLSGPDAEPGATPYKDGVPNLLKYAFNMNAAGPDRRTLVPGTGTAGLPVLRVESGTVRYEFLRRKNSGLTYTPLQSPSLNPNSWQTATGTETVTPIDDTWERVVLEPPLLPGGARFFAMRVGVE